MTCSIEQAASYDVDGQSEMLPAKHDFKSSLNIDTPLMHSMTKDDHVVKLEKNVDRQFTNWICKVLCLCKDLSLIDCPNCSNCTSVHDSLSMALEGHTILLIVPYCLQSIIKCMKHYFDCKASTSAPKSTSACIVIPKYYGRRHESQKSLDLPEPLRVNHFCRTAVGNAKYVECRSDGLQQVDVWYDFMKDIKVSSALQTPTTPTALKT